MLADLTREETETLLRILTQAHSHLRIEINRTDSIEYRDVLRRDLGFIEGIARKLDSLEAVTHH